MISLSDGIAISHRRVVTQPFYLSRDDWHLTSPYLEDRSKHLAAACNVGFDFCPVINHPLFIFWLIYDILKERCLSQGWEIISSSRHAIILFVTRYPADDWHVTRPFRVAANTWQLKCGA